jgi:transposase InsO family protein
MTTTDKEVVMPWKELSVHEQRLSVIHRVITLKQSVSQVAREQGISRKTLHKWLKRYRQSSDLSDYSHAPKHSPWKTDQAVEQSVLDLRRQYHWGPRKIHRLLLNRQQSVPSIRTVATILKRNDCVPLSQQTPPPLPPKLFERSLPNELWQLDHKGPIEVARQRVFPLTVLDDYSRYCLCFAPVDDLTVQTTWNLLWGLFGKYGLPDSILCDNAFSAPIGLSWFDARLVRLGIRPIHGRPRHPQTQGKVERFHGSAEREFIGFNARRDTREHFIEDCEQFRMTYNTIRPHEALDDLPPIARWQSPIRQRPPKMPEQPEYPPGLITRRVSFAGDFRYRNARILVGRGLTGQIMQIEEREQDIAVYYDWKLVRVIPQSALGGPRSHKNV